MAVFTVVSLSALNNWAKHQYGFCAVSAIHPISDGIENTNYRICADGQDYIFTIFELWQNAQVDYYAALMQHLNAAALPVPTPIAGSSGNLRHNWGDKPCLIVPFAAGNWISTPTAEHCTAIGATLAKMHIAAASFTPHTPNPRDGNWRQAAAVKIQPHLNADLQSLLATVVADDARFCRLPLPAAACHCDLFRNNVLWQDNAISAIIDFYFGGYDSLIFDLAICVCDWCYRDNGFDDALLSALIRGYSGQRQLCDIEKQHFSDALASAATRFWLSRHYDIIFPRQAKELTPHDPRHFERILRTIHSNRNSLTQLMQTAA